MSGGPLPEPRAHRASARSWKRGLVVLVTVVAMAAVGLLVTLRGGRDIDADSSATTSPRRTPLPPGSGDGGTAVASRWIAVLGDLDDRRADAWRRGELSLLRQVYVAGSPELSEDRTMLTAYRRRGLTVSGVEMTFLSVRVQDRHPAEVTLLVVDRLGPAVAHDAAGRRQELPRDLPTRHQIELHRIGRQWRIAGIAVV